jgi:hypothetical protein
VANPLDNTVNPIPAFTHWRLVHSWPLTHTLTGYGEYAHLDDRRTEAGIPQVEVEARHAPVSLGEGEPRNSVGRLPLVRGEHVLVLLRYPDRGHPGPAGRFLPGQMPAHHVDLSVLEFADCQHVPVAAGSPVPLLQPQRRPRRAR